MAIGKNINVKLDDEKDTELIEFLEGKPTTWIFKEAITMYMHAYKSMMEQGGTGVIPIVGAPVVEEHEKPQPTNPKAGSALKFMGK